MKTLLLPLLLLLATSLYSQPWYDASFGDNGRVYTNFGGGFHGKKILMQSDGKIVMTGHYFDVLMPESDHFFAMRFLPDGAPDDSFGVGGQVKIPAQNGVAAVLPNDQIVVAHLLQRFSRLQADGNLDLTFGANGTLWYPIDFPFNLPFNLIIEALPGGGWLTAGSSAFESIENGSFFVARFLQDGSADPAFGEGGHVFLDGYGVARAIAVQADGKMLALPNWPKAVIRLNPDGSMDEAFGNNGVALLSAPGFPEAGTALAIQDDQKILVVTLNGKLFRLTPQGEPDTGFGDGGYIQTSGDYDANRRLHVQDDGKIIAGYTQNNDFAIGRWHPDGSVDSLFGDNGVIRIDVWGFDQLSALHISPDGTILAGGHSDLELSLARLTPEGIPDPGFGPNNDGTLSVNLGGFYAAAVGIDCQSNGKCIAAGRVSQGDLALVRYLDNGQADPSFGEQGRVIINQKNRYFYPSGLKVLPDDKLLVSGSLSNHYFLYRFLPDGAPDPDFGDEGLRIIEVGQAHTGCHDLELLDDGSLLLAGRVNKQMALLRCFADGTVDESFGDQGWVINAQVAEAHDAKAVLVLPDGRIVVGGHNGHYYEDPYMVRLLPSGAIDPDFHFTEKFILAGDYNFGSIEDMILLDNGNIAFAGSSTLWTSLGSPDVAITGIVDPDGGMGEDIYYNYRLFSNGKDSFAHALVRRPDGKFVIAATGEKANDSWYGAFSGAMFFIIRFHSGENAVDTHEPPAANRLALRLSPNPVASQAVLSYELAQSETVSILLYDASGKHIHTFVHDEKRTAGEWREAIVFPEGLPAGAYVLKVRAGSSQGSLVLVK